MIVACQIDQKKKIYIVQSNGHITIDRKRITNSIMSTLDMRYRKDLSSR